MVKIKLDKSYYQYLIEDLSKALLREKNKLAQILDKELKEWGKSIGYSSKEVDITITFKKRGGKE